MKIIDITIENFRGFTHKYFEFDPMMNVVPGDRGGWNIWFTVFSGCNDDRNALLDFLGKARHCFDASNPFEPLDRKTWFSGSDIK